MTNLTLQKGSEGDTSITVILCTSCLMLYNVPAYLNGVFTSLAMERAGMYEADLLNIYRFRGLVFWLRVHGDEHPFDVTGHYPVLAGYDSVGREIFIARVDEELNYVYVADGARSVSIVDEDDERITFSEFDVLVLRHDPSDHRAQAIPEGAKFQTGPVYWIHEMDDDTSLDSDSDSDVEDRHAMLSPDDSSIDLLEEVRVELGRLTTSEPREAQAPSTQAAEEQELVIQQASVVDDTESNSATERTIIEPEKQRNGDLRQEEWDAAAELRRAHRLIEEQWRKLEAQQKELEEQKRKLDD